MPWLSGRNTMSYVWLAFTATVFITLLQAGSDRLSILCDDRKVLSVEVHRVNQVGDVDDPDSDNVAATDHPWHVVRKRRAIDREVVVGHVHAALRQAAVVWNRMVTI